MTDKTLPTQADYDMLRSELALYKEENIILAQQFDKATAYKNELWHLKLLMQACGLEVEYEPENKRWCIHGGGWRYYAGDPIKDGKS
jgi:hypothetical protein